MGLRFGFASGMALALAMTTLSSSVAIDSALAAKRISIPFAVRGGRSSSADSTNNDANAAAPATAAPRAAPAGDSTAGGSPGDLFNRHAAEKLEADKTAVQNPAHPLAEQLPHHYVTVCVAGCVRDKEHIAGVLPRPSLIEVAVVKADPALASPTAMGQLDTTAANADPEKSAVEKPATAEPAASLQPIGCVAGCYGYASPLPGSVSARAADNRWMTTVTKAEAGPAARPATAKKANQKRLGPSGEWFTRINRARGQ